MVLDHEGEYPEKGAAVCSIALNIGFAAQIRQKWMKKAKVDGGVRAGIPSCRAIPSEVRKRLRVLEAKNCELRQANEILREASAYFAEAEFDRRSKL